MYFFGKRELTERACNCSTITGTSRHAWNIGGWTSNRVGLDRPSMVVSLWMLSLALKCVKHVLFWQERAHRARLQLLDDHWHLAPRLEHWWMDFESSGFGSSFNGCVAVDALSCVKMR